VILESVNCIWVRRGAIGPSTIRAAIQVLRAGHVLGVAPEGTRSPTRALQPGKTGAVFLAVSAGVPIVPIAITGTEKAVEVFTLRRPRLTVTVGQPITFTLPTGGRRPDAQILEDHTAELMCRIAAMLPPEYRGVYAEHPRLKELLGDESHPPPPAPPPSPRPRAEERGAGG
jgi:1-acyl-sn-glycerol-3-phosphate acyltransferase